MNKRISLFLILIFLIVQTFSVVHMAEHGFWKHSHNGKNCEISDFYQQGKITDTLFILKLPSQVFFVITHIYNNDLAIGSLVYSASNPRAPPYCT